MYNGKKILILGGASQHCKVVDAAHELGLKVFVTDYLPDSPAKKKADVSLMYDVKDIEGIVDYCKKEKIDGIITTSLDPCQIPYQKICEKLALPCFGTEEQFFQLTNKNAFKTLCQRYYVDVIQTYSIAEVLDKKNAEEHIVFPIMIKPEDSRGSRGQSVCYDWESAQQALEVAQKESSTGHVIIEQYMKNASDFAVAYIVVNGIPHLIRTCDRYTGTMESGLDRVAIAASNPSKYTDMYLKNVNSKVISMLKGMGIQNGPVFMQGLVDKDTIRFYDPGFRFSGGEYEQLLKNATNVDLIKMLVVFSISGKMDDTLLCSDLIYLNGKRAFQLDPTLLPGHISNIIGKEKIKKHPNVVSFYERYEKGEIVPQTENVARRYAEICFLTDNKEEEIKLIKFIQDTLHILDEKGQELLCCPFQTSFL